MPPSSLETGGQLEIGDIGAADGTRLRGNEKTVAKKQALSARALSDLELWIADTLPNSAAA